MTLSIPSLNAYYWFRMNQSETENQTDHGAKRPRIRRLFFLASYLFYLTALLFVGTKLFWHFGFGVPLNRSLSPLELLVTFYPKLHESGVYRTEIAPDDEYFDVLALGGSVMDQASLSMETALRKRLGDRLRYFNMATAGHTSRDSFLKAEFLKDKSFDLILVYNGINDLAMNNVPAELFRDDYTHCVWYAGMDKRVKAGQLSLTDLASDRLKLIARSGQDRTTHVHSAVIKTTGPLRTNLKGIVDIAAAKHTPVVLMTFQHYIAEGYQEDLFHAGGFDYDEGFDRMEVEAWTAPQYVAPSLAAQNIEIENLAAESKNVILCDQVQHMPAAGKYFSDVCHMTAIGRDLFAQNIMDVIEPILPPADQ